jgi:polysaccharide biosynthesis protein PslH
MRILMVSQMTPYLPCHDGFRLVPAHLIRHLARHHTIALIAAGVPAERDAQRRWATEYCEWMEILPSARWRYPLSARPARGVALARDAVRRALERFAPDVLHLEGAALAPLVRSGVPTLLAVHDSRALRAREFRRLARTPWDWLRYRVQEWEEGAWERRWMAGADRCVVLSEEDRTALAAHVPPDRVVTLPNGVDLEHYAFRRIGRAGRLIFTGNLAWGPNVDAACRFATEIFPRVRRTVPDAELVIAGADPMPAVRALARRPGVRVTGTLPDLRPAIWGAGVFVSPLRAGFGLKNKVLQAMALGTPIVASARSLSGLSGVVLGEHCLGADRDDEFVDAVSALCRDPARADALARHARALVERRYGWPTVAQHYETVLADLAGVAGPVGALA